jgi:hypothetical protein
VPGASGARRDRVALHEQVVAVLAGEIRGRACGAVGRRRRGARRRQTPVTRTALADPGVRVSSCVSRVATAAARVCVPAGVAAPGRVSGRTGGVVARVTGCALRRSSVAGHRGGRRAAAPRRGRQQDEAEGAEQRRRRRHGSRVEQLGCHSCACEKPARSTRRSWVSMCHDRVPR